MGSQPEDIAAADISCTPPAIDDFPRDLFTEQQRQDGAVVIHAIIALYLFAALAVVCDKYFVPAVERICHALNMSNDVAGATFMAAATSAPELFVNVIGTFITEGDIGVGTIVGSAVFNILAVAACCGIGAGMVVPLDWWPLTRDCLAYGVTVSVLICIIHDERVEWYEALTLVLLYIVYIGVMYWDKSIQICARGGVGITSSRRQSEAGPAEAGEDLFAVKTDDPNKSDKTDKESKVTSGDNELQNVSINDKKLRILESFKEDPTDTISSLIPRKKGKDGDESHVQVLSLTTEQQQQQQLNGSIKAAEESPKNDEPGDFARLFTWPGGSGWWKQLVWVTTWPIHLIFLFTIPDCEKPRFKRLFPLTFFMCIVWIGSLSYVVAWLITIIGDTLKIPDSVMGITFLAAGTSVPEAVSSVIVAKQGHGSMGISNSIGSNTFDILLCLGLPWFIKASFLPTKHRDIVPGTENQGQHYVKINSHGLEYSAISLLSTLLMLYLTFYANKFKLDRKVGQACLLMYAVFLILASLIELNVFFTVNLPTCGR